MLIKLQACNKNPEMDIDCINHRRPSHPCMHMLILYINQRNKLKVNKYQCAILPTKLYHILQSVLFDHLARQLDDA